MKESLPWEITIRKVDNGFICSWKEEGEEENYIKDMQEVFEEKEFFSDENLEELENMKKLLEFIAEHFGINYSKHSHFNIKIEVEKNTGEDQ